MEICLTGASGLVGTALTSCLESEGHHVRRLTRGPSESGAARWDPSTNQIDRDAVEQADVMIHLAGENIGSGRWTSRKKERILRSRIDGTRLVSETLAAMSGGPRTLVSASAIGYYGSRGDACLTEESAPGDGFLAEVCRQWEAQTEVAARAGVRVVNVRIGVVLAPHGGALAKMLPLFRVGLGGRVGNGRQWWSWIALEDVARVLAVSATDDRLVGPVNAVAPEAVTNGQFTRTLGRVMRRPTILPFPAVAARLILGEMAEELLLSSTRVIPGQLHAIDFSFRYARLEHALRSILRRN